MNSNHLEKLLISTQKATVPNLIISNTDEDSRSLNYLLDSVRVKGQNARKVFCIFYLIDDFYKSLGSGIEYMIYKDSYVRNETHYNVSADEYFEAIMNNADVIRMGFMVMNRNEEYYIYYHYMLERGDDPKAAYDEGILVSFLSKEHCALAIKALLDTRTYSSKDKNDKDLINKSIL